MKKLINTLTTFAHKNKKNALVAGIVLIVVCLLTECFVEEDGTLVGSEE